MSTWQIDESHSAVTFSVKHMMVSTVRGRFGRFHGTIEYDPEQPAEAAVAVTIETASINTDWAQRDDHLRAPDFLDAAGNPELTFRSTRVEMTGEGKARIHGDLSIRGVAKPVVLEAERVAIVTGMQGERRAAFEARTRIDREAWGLTWNVGLEAGGWLVGKDITIDMDIAAVEQAVQKTASRAA
jgi:polyisoprenoid-binding protein YceI